MRVVQRCFVLAPFVANVLAPCVSAQQVHCSNTCADLDGAEDVTVRDFLIELAHYGQTVSAFDLDV